MKFSSATVTFFTLCATAPALAADLGDRPYGQAPAYAAPIYNWTDFYIGGHVGGGISSSEAFNSIVLSNNQSGRLLGGLQAGADYQFGGNWVAGVEGQYSWLGGGNNGIISPAASSTPTSAARWAR
jgi:outer membrane immunogenic protein